MEIKYEFDYEANWDEIADEFTANDSDYQAQVLERIGETFKKWSKDKTRTTTYLQLLEIAEGLDDDGKWFINTLHDYIQGINADEDKGVLEKINEKQDSLWATCKAWGDEAISRDGYVKL